MPNPNDSKTIATAMTDNALRMIGVMFINAAASEFRRFRLSSG